MNTLLLGPLLGNNRKALIERCAELVANHQNHKFLYIAASRPLLEIITDGILDGARNRGVWGELPVYLFRGFVRHVLRNAVDENGNGLPPRLPIDRDELPLKRSLISQILSRLKDAGKLKAIAPLAGRDGCVNSITTLVGELQRAAKTPAEVSAIIAARSQDFAQQSGSGISQIDFDNEVALIYSSYCELLQQNQLTENDADQLRALAVLRGTLDSLKIDVPILADVELLILDGFFDFTPVQGEILSELIPRIPETLVNLNYDPQNVEIFAPFTETVEQLKAVGTFEIFTSDERRETKGVLSLLRGNLFNPSLSDNLQIVGPSNSTSAEELPPAEELEGSSLQSHDKLKHVGQTSDNLQIVGPSNSTSAGELESPQNAASPSHDKLKHVRQNEIRYFECGDRETEIRAIAKEIKRLILVDHYSLSDIAVVVRQRDTYSKTITRIMREESVPCQLEWRIDAGDVPATRAALKILELLEHPVEDTPPYRISDLGDLIKSEYFRLSESELDKLNERFDANHLDLLSDDNRPFLSDAKTLSKRQNRIGFWDADSLENAFAYVGSELPLGAWLARAQKLIKELPTATATKELLSIDANAQDQDTDIADQVENAETARLDEGVEKKRRPSRDIHPATLAWTALVIQRFSELLFAVPREGTPNDLRQGLMRLFDQFGFRDQITRPARSASDEGELPQVMLNFNALESLRRALLAAVKSLEMSDKLQFVGPSNTRTAEEFESSQDAASPSHDKLKHVGQTSDKLQFVGPSNTSTAEEFKSPQGAASPSHDKLKHVGHRSDKLQFVGPSNTTTTEEFKSSQDAASPSHDKLKHVGHTSDKLQFVGPSNTTTTEELKSPKDAASPRHDKLKHVGHTSDKLQFVGPSDTSTAEEFESPQDAASRSHDKLKHVGHTSLAILIGEIRRSLVSQSQLLGPADPAGLRVLEATDVRGLQFKALFIAGLVEGGFPLRASRDWIYPHEERDRLKKYGLTLEDISPATLLKEEHYFYQSACRATERLYLTRPVQLEDDSETVASYYIDELRRAIAPRTIEPEVVRRDYDGKAIAAVSNTQELSVSLVRQQERHLHHGEKQKLLPQPRIKRLLTLARNDGFLTETALRRIEIERERAGSHFGPYDGQITDPNLLALLQRKFGSDFVHSASGLSVFGNCAYRFFAQRVLKLEPRGEAALDLQAIDAGKLLHDILRRFFEKHRREALHMKDHPKLRYELLEIADGVFDEHERVVPPLNRQIWKIDREIRKILLEQVLLYELHLQEESEAKGVVPSFFEIAFGGSRMSAKDPSSVEDPLTLTRDTFVGEETMKISGQIDRVDLARDNTLIAYDYKLSVGATKEDIRSARQLQIPIYLEALEKLILPEADVAGGGYYIIRGGNDRRNRGMYRKDKTDYYRIKASTMAVMSEEEWREIRNEVIARIWDFLDQMRAGRFLVNPAERTKTCKFCDFSAVCRYDRGRIEVKKRWEKK